MLVGPWHRQRRWVRTVPSRDFRTGAVDLRTAVARRDRRPRNGGPSRMSGCPPSHVDDDVVESDGTAAGGPSNPVGPRLCDHYVPLAQWQARQRQPRAASRSASPPTPHPRVQGPAPADARRSSWRATAGAVLARPHAAAVPVLPVGGVELPESAVVGVGHRAAAVCAAGPESVLGEPSPRRASTATRVSSMTTSPLIAAPAALPAAAAAPACAPRSATFPRPKRRALPSALEDRRRSGDRRRRTGAGREPGRGPRGSRYWPSSRSPQRAPCTALRRRRPVARRSDGRCGPAARPRGPRRRGCRGR